MAAAVYDTSMEASRVHIVFYSIYHSSNCYLGSILAARALRDLPVTIERRPLYIPRERGLLVADLVGGRESEARASYNREDCKRWASKYGIELNMISPETFAARAEKWKRSPLAREELAARVYYSAVGSGKEADIDRAFFRCSYVDGLDVNDEAVVRSVLLNCGLDPDVTMKGALSAETKATLDESLAAFLRDRGPGLPTWIVAGERFWGKDRADWLAERVRQLCG